MLFFHFTAKISPEFIWKKAIQFRQPFKDHNNDNNGDDQDGRMNGILFVTKIKILLKRFDC